MLVFSLVAHEYAHGYAALKQGDDTALSQGRLTFNPIAHIDPWLTILMPLMIWYGSGGKFAFGGARPVEVRPDKYRNYVRGDIIVSLAGVATNLLIALVCGGLFVLIGLVALGVPDAAPALTVGQRMLHWGVWLNLMLGFFNLMPIPPLDGSHVLFHLLPRGLRSGYRALQRFGFLLVLVLMIFLPQVLQRLLLPATLGLELFRDLAAPYAAGPEWMILQR